MGTINIVYFYGNVRYIYVDVMDVLYMKKLHINLQLRFRILQGSTDIADSSNDGGPEFAEVFVIVWIGSMVVTLNSKLLGGNM